MTVTDPRGVQWLDEDKDKLWFLYGRFPMKIIASVLSRTPGACRVQICRMKHQRADRKPDLGNDPRETVGT